jgi:hypothetical protein
MIAPLMSTVIVTQLNAAGGAARNGATQLTVPIDLAKRPRRSLLYRRRSPSLGAVLNRRRHRRTTGALFAAAKRTSSSIAATPEPLSP